MRETSPKKDPRTYLRLGSIFEGKCNLDMSEFYYFRFINAVPEHPMRAGFEKNSFTKRKEKINEKNKSTIMTTAL